MEKKHKVLTILDFTNREIINCEHEAIDFSYSNEFEAFYLPLVTEYMESHSYDYEWHVVDSFCVLSSNRLTKMVRERTDMFIERIERERQCA